MAPPHHHHRFARRGRATTVSTFFLCKLCGQAGHSSVDCRRGAAAAAASPAAVLPNAGVYVLRVREGGAQRFYVGKSSDIARRINEHMRGESSCSAHKADSVVRVAPSTAGSVGDMEAWERAETLHLMHRHGVDRVRGWRFVARGALPKGLARAAFAEVCERFDLCRTCGRAGHFATACRAHSDKAKWARCVA